MSRFPLPRLSCRRYFPHYTQKRGPCKAGAAPGAGKGRRKTLEFPRRFSYNKGVTEKSGAPERRGFGVDLRELAAYAGEAYGMAEQHKWPEFPGISVLADRATGKWVALLMRFWDYDQGQEIQHCDIKCGQEVLWQDPAP